MDRRTTTQLKPFLERIKKKFAPVRFILFGSRARDDALETSDYDILIISPRFHHIPFYQRHVEVYHLQKEQLSIDVICLTPEEYAVRSKELSVIREAAREGVELAA